MTRYLTFYGKTRLGNIQLGYNEAAYIKYNDGENFGWKVCYVIAAGTAGNEMKYDRYRNADNALTCAALTAAKIGAKDSWVEITKQLADYLVNAGHFLTGDEAIRVFNQYMNASISSFATSAKEFLPCDADWEKRANAKRDDIFRRMGR